MAYNAVGYLNQQQQVVGGLNATGGLSATLNNAVVSQSSIAQYPSIDDFPATGSSKILYVDQGTMTAYLWEEDYEIIATTDHSDLKNRLLENQHSIGSITNLQRRLDEKVNEDQVISNLEILQMMME